MKIYLISLLFISFSPAAIGAGDRRVGSTDAPTVYEALESYGFPPGILPVGVTKYELDSATGKFTVHLDKDCSFTIQGYQLKYKKKITGVVSYRKLGSLTGVQVKILFIWLGIGEVSVDGNDMEFTVGIASADFPVDGFYESPQCGCGFDCANAAVDGGGNQLVSAS